MKRNRSYVLPEEVLAVLRVSSNLQPLSEIPPSGHREIRGAH